MSNNNSNTFVVKEQDIEDLLRDEVDGQLYVSLISEYPQLLECPAPARFLAVQGARANMGELPKIVATTI